jgi:type IV pilus assembly protein PilO
MKRGIREPIFAVMMVALLIGTFVMYFRPRDQWRQRQLADVRAMDNTLTNLRVATAGINDLKPKIDEIEHAIHFFESKLPQEREMDTILKEVWQMAQSDDLQTRSVKTLKAEKAAGYSELPIEMSLSGDFGGFYSFLLQLETLPRITRITQMKLDKIADRDGQMQVTMTLSIFFEPDGGNSGAMTAAAR